MTTLPALTVRGTYQLWQWGGKGGGLEPTKTTVKKCVCLFQYVFSMDAPNKSRTRPKKTTRTVLTEVTGPLLLSSRPPLDSDLGDVDSNLGDVDSTREGLELPFESTARERRVAIAAERATYLLICRSERSLNLVIHLKPVSAGSACFWASRIRIH